MVDDEVDLVRRCLAGDEEGMRAFVDRFQGLVFGLCYRLLGHRQDAEDVSQDVFFRVFRSLHRWDSKRPLKPWVTTIAVNRCRTALERRAQQARRVHPSDFVLYKESEGDPLGRYDLAEELQLALLNLREEYRVCFVLFYQEEMSCAEIGETLECPSGTVKTWLYRARGELAQFLKRRGIVSEVGYEMP